MPIVMNSQTHERLNVSEEQWALLVIDNLCGAATPWFYHLGDSTEEQAESARKAGEIIGAYFAKLGGEAPAPLTGKERARANWGKVRKALPRFTAARRHLKALVDAMDKVGMVHTRGTRMLGEHYWLEALDPKHRVGHFLNDLLPVFREERAADPSLPISFFDWLTEDKLESVKFKFNAESRWIFDELKKRVEYLDAAGRKTYQVVVLDGFLHSVDEGLLDTGQMSTAFSGLGFGIFVMSEQGQLYVNSHKTGEFHHSSFLAGMPVKAAGEMLVRAGKLIMISAKSGHYQPAQEELIEGLKELRSQGLSVGNVKVRLYPKGPDGKPIPNQRIDATDPLTNRAVPKGVCVPHYLTAWEFMNNANVRNRYVTWDR